MVPVGDEQLGVAQRVLDGLDRVGIGDPPEAVGCAVVVGELAPRRSLERGRDCAPGGAGRVRVEGEDRGEVRPRGAGQAQAVLLRAGVRPLVRPDPAGPVLLDADAGEQAVAGQPAGVRCDVVLGERPDRRLIVPDDGALGDPAPEQLRGVLVRVAAVVGLRQVDRYDVVRRPFGELGPLLGVDDVVGRSRDAAQRTDDAEVVVQGTQRLDVGHGGRP